MQQFMAITKALGDESRVRILLSLRGGELCVCQIVELLGLAPSTVSKHVDLLRQAGLVDRRKEGRWHYYRLAGPGASPVVHEAIGWALRSLERDAVIVADGIKLRGLRESDRSELTACYSRG
jgi:ArsR family transcriptional regulator, arsenate/arsenite/antimonite-responsive transcriptional repressor